RGGSSGQALVLAQRNRTDAALRRYQQARDGALAAAGALASAYTTADSELGRLPEARANQRRTGDQTYHDIPATAVEPGEALPGQLSDPHLAGVARAVAELTASAHALALQRDLVRAVLTRGTYTATDQSSLADLAAVERDRRAAFLRATDGPAKATY